jgi:hypothetical protein
MNAYILPAVSNALYTIRSAGTAPESSGDLDLLEVGTNGSGTVYIKPHGYWSRDPITLYIRREFNWKPAGDQAGKWKIEVSHSSGGRANSLTKKDGTPDPEGVVDDLEAEDNFGAAIRAACQYGRQIREHFPVMEEAYQIQRQLDDAKYEADCAAKLATVEADLPLGLPAAKKLVAIARANLQKWHDEAIILAYARGAEASQQLVAKKTARITWYWGGYMIGEDAAIAKLAEMSCRTTLA